MSLRKAWFILPCIAVAVALVAFLLTRGRGTAVQSASDVDGGDEAYYAKLAAKRAERLPIAAERAKTAREMEAIIAEARNSLASEGVESPTDEQLKKEIEGHPEKYPAWKELHAKMLKLNSEFSAKLAEAQGIARERMVRSGVQVPGMPRQNQGK